MSNNSVIWLSVAALVFSLIAFGGLTFVIGYGCKILLDITSENGDER